MNFNNNVYSYLKGDTFSNGLVVKYEETPLFDLSKTKRLEAIESICKGKKVIHIGCVDHIPLIKNKIERNIWLHKIITDCATECIGLDIAKDGVEYCNKELSYSNVHYMDIENDELIAPLLEQKWDVMILGEILEHVDNPVQFLQKINQKFSSICTTIIITVPNAFCYQYFFNAFKNKECINTDHRYYFTPFTLAKCLTRANYQVKSFEMYHRSYPTFNIIRRFWLCFPLFRHGIIMSADF